jgi:hypothetical protein
MNVHLISTPEVESDLLIQIRDLLNSFSGPLRFRTDPVEDYFKYRGAISWANLFNLCAEYRDEKQIPLGDFVLVLTNIPNQSNWFSSLDEHNPTNGFVHAADWESFIACPPIYPIAYLVATLALQKHMFTNYRDVEETVHLSPIGCMNDYCANKKEIILKLRTGDICSTCFERLLNNNTPELLLRQVQAIMESIRVKMLYSYNFKRPKTLSKLVIKKTCLILEDYENISVDLRPLELALYILYLRHESGIKLVDLVDFREEIKIIYAALSNSALRGDIDARINQLVDVRTNSASEKISRIKQVFTRAIGPTLSDCYIIKGKNAEVKMISLDRSKIIW